EVLVAEDTASALELCGRERPHIVLADMGLRDESRQSLCQALRQREDGRELPLIAICSSRGQAGTALESGATELLERPFDWRVASLRAERLVRLSETAAGLHRLQEEMDRLQHALEEERRQRTWRDQSDALTGLPNG